MFDDTLILILLPCNQMISVIINETNKEFVENPFFSSQFLFTFFFSRNYNIFKIVFVK